MGIAKGTRIRIALLTCCIAIGVAPHSRAQDFAAPPAVEKAILDRMEEIKQAAVDRDVDRVFGFYRENDHGALIEDGVLRLTRQDALEATRRGFEGLTAIDYRFDQQHIALLSPTVALVTATGHSEARIIDGRVLEVPFAQSVILTLEDGQWQVVHAHRSFRRGR